MLGASLSVPLHCAPQAFFEIYFGFVAERGLVLWRYRRVSA